jgi:hypothetical protein
LPRQPVFQTKQREFWHLPSPSFQLDPLEGRVKSENGQLQMALRPTVGREKFAQQNNKSTVSNADRSTPQGASCCMQAKQVLAKKHGWVSWPTS